MGIAGVCAIVSKNKPKDNPGFTVFTHKL